MIKRLICHKCGAVNEVEADKLNDSQNDWLEVCDAPAGFEWRLPAGKITPVIGDPIYITSTGAHMSREAYIEKYGLDPEIALRMMRGMGRAVKETVRATEDLCNEAESSWVPSSIKRIVSRFNRSGQEVAL